MPGAGTAAVFLEAHSKAPVELVFHAPVAAHGAREAPDVRGQAAQVVAALGSRCAAGDFAHGFDDAHGAQGLPLGAVGEPADVAALPVAPDFDSAVAFLHGSHFHQVRRGAEDRVVEEGADFAVRGALVAFEGEHVVGVGFVDFAGGGFLGSAARRG